MRTEISLAVENFSVFLSSDSKHKASSKQSRIRVFNQKIG